MNLIKKEEVIMRYVLIVPLLMNICIPLSSLAECQPERLESCRTYIAKRWEKLCKIMGKASGLRDELPSLPPRSSWWLFSWPYRDQQSQSRKIDDLLDDARDILLSESAKDILTQVRRLDAKIKKINRDIADVSKERVLHPERKAKCDEAIRALTASRYAVRRDQLRLKRDIMIELRSWGLSVSETALEPFFSSVTCDSIIDNAVVAGNIAAVVKNLGELMQCDVDNARRYYGMYLVLIDIQVRCYRDFVDKCDALWLKRVDELIYKVQYDHLVAEEGMCDSRYTGIQRDIYKKNKNLNSTMLRAARLYRECLEKQRISVVSKMASAERMRDVALNTYETIGNAIALKDLMQSSAETFDAVMKLEFPDLAAFNDAELVAEFQGITDRIMVEK